MSELKEFLRPAQLIKHYELLQYLSKHPNTTFTLSELDYVLPHGASLQRFPLEWVEYMAQGGCANRNIELHISRSFTKHSKHTDVNNNDSEELESEELSRILHAHSFDRDSITILCRQPEIHSLASLAELLQSPSTLLDAEGCVALHTDQILISEDLIALAQKAGVAYYFSDKYDKNELQATSPKLKSKSNNFNTNNMNNISNNTVSNDTNNMGSVSGMEMMFSSSHNLWPELIASTHHNALAMTAPHLFLTLPPGVRLRYKLLTTSGVPIKDEHSFPLRLKVFERLLLIFDDFNAVTLLHKTQTKQTTLSVKFDFAAIKLIGATENDANVASGFVESQAKLPLRIRMKTVQMKVGTINKISENEYGNNLNNNESKTSKVDSSSSSSSSSNNATQPLFASQVRVEMEAVYAAQFKLIVTVNGNESIVNMETTDVAVVMPGVIIKRDASPLNFIIPTELQLHDEFIESDNHYNDRGNSTKTMNTKREDDLKAISPLPWWQYTSPLTSMTRDFAFPTENTIQAANKFVYTPSALAHEKILKSTKLNQSLRLQQQREEEEKSFFNHSTTRRKRRRTSKVNVDLSNKHLLHFGLDASIPFTLKEQNDNEITSSME